MHLPMGANPFGPGIGGCRGAHFLRSCPRKGDGSGAASSHLQSIHSAGCFVQWGPRSLSFGPVSRVLPYAQLSAMLRPPSLVSWLPFSLPLPHTGVLMGAHMRTHRLAISLPSPSSLANTLASCHWYWCQYSEEQDADCPVLDLHVLSFDVFLLASFCSFLLYIYSNKTMQQYPVHSFFCA